MGTMLEPSVHQLPVMSMGSANSFFDQGQRGKLVAESTWA